MMRNLSHPNIIKLHEVYEGEYHIYLVMDMLKGGELFDRVVKIGYYSERDACFIFKQILSAIDYLHDRNIMHRDIKPENLILRSEDSLEIVLADFGLAECFNKKSKIFNRCGTPGYVAPEILDDQPYDLKVDVFSAGVIFYILLTGCSVFSGKSYNEIISKNRNCKINWSFEKINIFLSQEALDLLHALLEKKPENRPTIKEALNHPWFKKFEESKEKNNFEEIKEIPSMKDDELFKNELKLIRNNFIQFQDERKKLVFEKNSEQIMNSPIINGHIDSISYNSSNLNSPVASPQNAVKIKGNLTEMHKKALKKHKELEEKKLGKYLPTNIDKNNENNDKEDNDTDFYTEQQKETNKKIVGRKNIRNMESET